MKENCTLVKTMEGNVCELIWSNFQDIPLSKENKVQKR